LNLRVKTRNEPNREGTQGSGDLDELLYVQFQDATPEIRQRRSDVLLKLANGDIETVEVCLFEDWEGTFRLEFVW
jgi:hypothetical protein